MISEFLVDLNDKQREICLSKENLLVTSCPGSGKTRTLIYKIAYTLLTSSSIKRIIAITYTNRAADEIMKRLLTIGVDYSRVWVGTIHQFCLDFILNRFRMYNPNISKEFSIIDERISNQYLSEIAKKNGVSIGYDNKPNLRTDRDLKPLEVNEKFKPIIREYYQKLKENKEIDFDMILSHSINILKKSELICSAIKNSIELICIDEYQDTQDLQYAIIEKIYNSNMNVPMQINFFGDPNQAIFDSLGGCVKTLTDLNSEFIDRSFKEVFLTGCYRSPQNIIDFYTNFMTVPYQIESKINGTGDIFYSDNISKDNMYENIANIVDYYLKEGIKENEICIVAPTWSFLFPLSTKLKNYLPNVSFDAPDITPIKREPLNIFYNISYLALTMPKLNTHLYRIKVASDIISKINNYIICDVGNINLLNHINSIRIDESDGVEYLKKIIDEVLNFFNIKDINHFDSLKKEYDMFFEKIEFRISSNNLSRDISIFKKMYSEKNGVVVNTIHGIKGEEYKVVIGYGILDSKIPSIYTPIAKREETANKLLYVLASRCKKHLILFSEIRYTKKSGRLIEDKCSRYFSDKPLIYTKFFSSKDFWV